MRGEQVRPDKVYTAAFVTMQGVSAEYGTNRQNLEIFTIEAMQRYLARNKPVEAGLRGTIVAV